ncbi:MAG TPA: hypothetical protein V6D03_13500 [Candidatus Caenarcaniphilales bacterium]
MAIPGATKTTSVEDSMQAVEVTLSKAQVQPIDREAVKPGRNGNWSPITQRMHNNSS